MVVWLKGIGLCSCLLGCSWLAEFPYKDDEDS